MASDLSPFEDQGYLSAALGTKGLDRLAYLFTIGDGWDGPTSMALNLKSVLSAQKLFNQYRLDPRSHLQNRVGVYFCPSGNLALGFELIPDHYVEVEFGVDFIEVYFEHSGEEVKCRLDSPDLEALMLRVKGAIE
jgi:hypothetical protein